MEEKAKNKLEEIKGQKASEDNKAVTEERSGSGGIPAENKYAAKIFWGFLIGGSIFWILVLFVVTYIFTQLVPVSETAGGLIIVVCAAVLYLWGFVLSVLSFIAALKIKNAPIVKTLYILGVILYMCVLFTGLFVLIHLAMII